MSDGAFPDRLTQLRNRWEADPSSRIFLQLAEEYRHQGRVKEALDVLDRGLKEHPGYLSALVAKGRCHLELGEPEAARTVLERVVKQDATQMVANKLLVRAYLDTGEPERARERLDLYSLLNDSDPEIEELRRRLRTMEQPPQTQAPDPFRAPDSPFSQRAQAPPPAPPAQPPGGDIFDLGVTASRRAITADVFELDAPAPAAPARTAAAARPDDPFADLLAPAPAAPVPPAPVPAPAATAAAVAEPEPLPAEPEEEPEPEDVLFPGLASRDSRRRYLDHLGSEGIFLLDLTPAAPAPAAAAAPEVAEVFEAPAVPEPEPEPEPVWTAAPEPLPAWEEPTEIWAPAPEAPETAEEPEPEPVPVFDLEAPAPWEPEPLAAAEIAPTSELSVIPEDASLPPTLAMPVIPEAFAAPPVSMPGPVATATLGELYLSQGHLGEAERIFHEILRREPDNADALVGLERLAARRAERRPLGGRDLLAGYEPGEEGGEVEVRARKAWVLTQYLRRLRGGGQSDVS